MEGSLWNQNNAIFKVSGPWQLNNVPDEFYEAAAVPDDAAMIQKA